MADAIDEIVDRAAYLLDDPGSATYRSLVSKKRADLARTGMFNLEQLVRPHAVAAAVAALSPAMAGDSFTHKRSHNVYFRKSIPELANDHPALNEVQTMNHTLCADQLPGNPVIAIYEWPGLAGFLADVMDKPGLFPMDDPLARVNVMEYREGEALNWHFDRSEFTTTLLLQAPSEGGDFQYRSDLRTNTDQNYDGVAKLLRGKDPEVQTLSLTPCTLNVFKGVNTPHRATRVSGSTSRIIAVFSYYDRPGATFSASERQGFYGRTG